MLAHVGMQDHVYNQIAKVAKVSLLHVGENVAVMLLDQPAKKNYGQLFSRKAKIVNLIFVSHLKLYIINSVSLQKHMNE